MKTNAKFYLTPILFLFTIFFGVNSQIVMTNLDEISKIKNGTTYIAMNDPDSEENKEYIEIFKKYWTLSKFEFIKYSEVEKHISPTSSFLTMGGYETSAQFTTLYANGSSREGISYSNTHLYLELWTCSDKFFKKSKKKKEFGNKYKLQVSRLELYTDYETLKDPDKLYQSNYDGDGHIYNWGPGILKNQIKTINSFLENKRGRGLYSGVKNEKELQKLENKTLYVPDYTLIKFGQMTGDESKKHDEKELLEEYKYKYEIIPTEELNEKILSEKDPFYYLIYIKSSTDKFVTIVNSATGELIYSKYSGLSYNMRSKDFKEIFK